MKIFGHTFSSITYSLSTLLGRRGTVFLLLGVVAGLFRGTSDGIIAYALQGLMVVLGAESPVDSATGPGGITPVTTILGVCLLLLAGGMLRAFLTYMTVFCGHIVCESTGRNLKNLLIANIFGSGLKLPPSRSRMSYLLSDANYKTSTFVLHIGEILSLLVQVTVLFVLCLAISLELSVIGLVGLGIAGIGSHLLNQHAARAVKALPDVQFSMISTLHRVVDNFVMVRVAGTTLSETKKAYAKTDEYYHVAIRAQNTLTASSVFPQFISAPLMAGIVYYAYSYSSISSQSLFAFLYCYFRFSQNVGSFASVVSTAVAKVPFFNDAVELVEQNSAQNEEIGVSKRAQENAVPPAIEVENVSFAWMESQAAVHRDLNLVVKPGQVFGLVGESGSGKSTLMWLLMGCLKPTSGRITLAGMAPEKYLLSESPVGYVGAQPFLFAGTIRENLLYGVTDKVTDETIWSTLDDLGLSPVVRTFPEGLDHVLQESGVGLSMGQSQRLCLARCLLSQAKIMFLDEVTANLDSSSEIDVIDALAKIKGSVTIILSSHRETTMAIADQVYNCSKDVVSGAPDQAS